MSSLTVSTMNTAQRNYPSNNYGRIRYPLQAAYGGYIPPYSQGTHNNNNNSNMPTDSGSSSPGGGNERLSSTNLYIRKLPPETTDKDLLGLCQEFGKIISTKAIIDTDSTKCKGYGFVDFDSPQAANLAMKALKAKGYQAQMARQQEQDPTNLYIANLPPTMGERELEQLLQTHGTVVSTRILRDNNGMSKGVGFARMDSRETCDKIIKTFNRMVIPGVKEPLNVKFADGANKKKAQARQWVERPATQSFNNYRNPNNYSNYGQNEVTTNGSIRTNMTPSPHYGSYALPTHSITSYTSPTNWMQGVQGGYLMQPAQVLPAGSHGGMLAIDPNSLLPHLTNHMGQLQLSGNSYLPAMQGSYPALYPSAQNAQILQPLSLEDSANSATLDEQHFSMYGQTTAAK